MLQDRKGEVLLAYYTLSALHLYTVARRTKAGSAERALACAPMLLLNFCVPFLFDRHTEPCLLLVIVFGVTWQANFKVRGPAVACPSSRLMYLLYECGVELHACCCMAFFPQHACTHAGVRRMCARIAGLCLNRSGLCQPLDFLQFWAVLWLPIAVHRVTQSAACCRVSSWIDV